MATNKMFKNDKKFKEYLRSFLKTVNFKGFSSALESQKFIQVVFKDFKE